MPSNYVNNYHSELNTLTSTPSAALFNKAKATKAINNVTLYNFLTHCLIKLCSRHKIKANGVKNDLCE